MTHPTTDELGAIVTALRDRAESAEADLEEAQAGLERLATDVLSLRLQRDGLLALLMKEAAS